MKHFLEPLDIEGGIRKPTAAEANEAKNDSNAAYLLNQDDNIARQVFPALVEMNGTFSKIGPYFNATNHRGQPHVGDHLQVSLKDRQLTRSEKDDIDKALPRLRAQIQLKQITTSDRLADFYPPGAVRASKAAFKGFIYTQQSLRDQHKDVGKYGFCRNHLTTLTIFPQRTRTLRDFCAPFPAKIATPWWERPISFFLAFGRGPTRSRKYPWTTWVSGVHTYAF